MTPRSRRLQRWSVRTWPVMRRGGAPAHRFRVASHSKTFTAAGILKLFDADRLRLGDCAGTHVG